MLVSVVMFGGGAETGNTTNGLPSSRRGKRARHDLKGLTKTKLDELLIDY